jgi:hypothetical protein
MSLLVLSLLLLVSLPAQADSPLYVSIDGPIAIGKGETMQYVVNALGGPAEASGGNYSYKASIVGTDANTASVLPTSGTSVTGKFYMNVTAGGVADIVLRVNVTSISGSESMNEIAEYGIRIMEPVVITAQIENAGSAQVEGLPVTINADGVIIHKTNVTIGPQATFALIYNWTDPDLSKGKHVFTVVLDADNEFITFEGGGTVYTVAIHYGEDDYGTWNILLAVLAGFLIFLASSFYRRPSKRR